MRKVRYEPANHMYYALLEAGKVYDVLKDVDNGILIVNEIGEKEYYDNHSDFGVLEFIDVTKEYRNEIINSILE